MLGVDGHDLTGRRRSVTSGPPMMSDSLFARASVLPASSAASVASRPTAPLMPLSTTSAPSRAKRARGGRPHDDPDAVGAGPLQRVADGLLGVLAGHADEADPQPYGLLGQQLRPAPLRGERDDTEPVGVALDDVDGLGADRPGRAEQDDAAGGGHAADSSGSRLRRLRRGRGVPPIGGWSAESTPPIKGRDERNGVRRLVVPVLAGVMALLAGGTAAGPATSAPSSVAAVRRPALQVVQRGGSGPAAGAGVNTTSRTGLAAVRAYWTAQRMASARPGEELAVAAGVRITRSSVLQTYLQRLAPRRSAPQPAQRGAAWTGGGAVARTTGKVFFSLGADDYVCSGSAVDSPDRSTVLTAGHCVIDPESGTTAANWVFVPGYGDGRAPYGIFPATHLATTAGWRTSEDFDVDVAFANVGPNGAGKRLVDAVGAQSIAFGTARGQTTFAFGYPAVAPWTGERLIYCSGVVVQDTASGAVDRPGHELHDDAGFERRPLVLAFRPAHRPGHAHVADELLVQRPSGRAVGPVPRPRGAVALRRGGLDDVGLTPAPPRDQGIHHRRLVSSIVGTVKNSLITGRGGGITRRWDGQRGMPTYFVSRYSSMPSKPPSRPKPDCFTPPNGAAGFDTMPVLTPTIPDSIPSATRSARAQVVGVDVGHQAVLGAVGQLQGLLVRAERRHGRHRPEDLLAQAGAPAGARR